MIPHTGDPSMQASAHLTDDELDELLISDGDPQAALSEQSADHLSACDLCRARVTEFSCTVATFNQASMAWTEARSTTSTYAVKQRIAQRSRFRLSFAELGPITAALLVAAGMIAHANFGRVADAGAASLAQGTTQVAHSEGFMPVDAVLPGNDPKTGVSGNAAVSNGHNEEIASDNQMLFAIDSALSAPEPLPAGLDLTTGASTSVHPLDKDLRNDWND